MEKTLVFTEVTARRRRRPTRTVVGIALVAPTALFLVAFFILPNLSLISLSVTAQMKDGVLLTGLTLENYRRAFAIDLYWVVLLRTVRIAATASIVAAFFAYPLAMAIARGGSFARVVTLVVVAPLLVNVVIRSYAWSQLLSRQGALNWVLGQTGIVENAPQLLYTEWAVLIASVHVFLPFLVLPLASSMEKIPGAVVDAARVAGASAPATLWRVILPLSLPGLVVGMSLVFSLTAAAYVTPQILGGNFAPLVGTLIEQQVLSLNDWPFGAALATLLVGTVLLVNLVFLKAVERKTAAWTAGAPR
jgi:putative spermidine/putrescine transport system permease protein